MTERKKGVVRGFTKCSEDYLKLIISDLGLDADVKMLKYLQTVYTDEKREPKVGDLYFDTAALKKSCTLQDSELCSGLESTDLSLTGLFSRFASRASAVALSDGRGYPFVRLAEFAAGIHKGETAGSCFLSPADKPEFPDNLSRGACYFRTETGLMYFSPEEKHPASDSADALMLIYPEKGQDCDSYWKTAADFVLSLLDEIPSASLISCTSDGLLSDISSVFPSVCIYPGELPATDGTPESVLKSFAPGVMVRLSSDKTSKAVKDANKLGLFASVPAICEESGNSIRLFSSGEPVVLPSGHLKNIRLYRKNTVRAEETELHGRGPLRVSSPLDCDIRACELDGAAYEALSKALAGCRCGCIYGSLNPRDPATVNFILALDAFVRNTGTEIAACRFSCGDETKISVMALDSCGCVQKLDRCGLPAFELPVYEDKTMDTENTSEINDRKAPASGNVVISREPAGKVVSSLAELAGNTPMLRIYPELGAAVFAKLEMFNPAGSAKDRVALSMLRTAEACGELKPGGTVIEATSGNTGIGLACYGVALGYKVIIIMPDTMSAERIQLIKAYGAEVILTPGAGGMAASNELAAKMKQENPDAFIASQFSNPANPSAHEKTTGPEIWRDLGGKVDYLVAGIGTGGTLCGSAAYLKKMNPQIKIIGCEPASSPLLTQGKAGTHKIQGIGANFVPDNYKAELVDGIIDVSNEDAIAETQQLARNYGLLAGISSGCAVWAAKKIAAMPSNAGKNIAVILPDTGEHYLSTGIFG